MSKQVIAFLNEALQGGQRAALCTLIESGADSPGKPGSLMAVRQDGSTSGTVGGGASEGDLIRRVQKALQEGSDGFSFSYDLTTKSELGMVCGGAMSGYVRIFLPEARLIIFGGGHVGRKLSESAKVAGFDVTVVEDREMSEIDFPGIRLYLTEDFAKAAEELAPYDHSFIVIVTRGHAHDYRALRSVITSGAAYIGMIGSKKKVLATIERLKKDDVPQELIDRIYAPIGLNIDDGTPSEIAISILAEILLVKNNGQLRHMRTFPPKQA